MSFFLFQDIHLPSGCEVRFLGILPPCFLSFRTISSAFIQNRDTVNNNFTQSNVFFERFREELSNFFIRYGLSWITALHFVLELKRPLGGVSPFPRPPPCKQRQPRTSPPGGGAAPRRAGRCGARLRLPAFGACRAGMAAALSSGGELCGSAVRPC